MFECLYRTPVSQFDSEILINSSHCHDEHQVNLNIQVKRREELEDCFPLPSPPYHGPASAGQHWCKLPGVRVIEQPDGCQGPVDDDGQYEYENQTYLEASHEGQ